MAEYKEMRLTQTHIDRAMDALRVRELEIAYICPIAQMLRDEGYEKASVGVDLYFLTGHDEGNGFKMQKDMKEIASAFTYHQFETIKPTVLKVRTG